MDNALLRSRQIFKFGLLNKKDNKKNLKIRLVFIRMVVAFFPPYYSYTNPLADFKQTALLTTMKKATLIFSLVLSTNLIFGQSIPKRYFDLVKKADSLYNAKDFRSSAEKYSDAFKSNGWKGLSGDRYNAACSWALSAVTDSAFFFNLKQ